MKGDKFNMKKNIIGLTMMLIIISGIVLNSYTSVYADGNDGEKYVIEFITEINEAYTGSFRTNIVKYSEENKDRNYAVNKIGLWCEVTDNNQMIQGILTCYINDEYINVDVKGQISYYSEEEGYVAVLDGIGVIDGNEEMITVDMIYHNSKDVFTAITIGSAGKLNPQIIFFGTYTDCIANLSEANIELSLKSKVPENEQIDIPNMLQSVDATTKFQATKTNYISQYESVTISLYHADELRNQSSMSVYAKVNSHTDSFKKYLINELGYNAFGSSLTVYPDSYMIKIVGADKYLHSNGNITPTSASTSVDVTFPAYLPYVGFFTFGVPITTNKVDVNYSGIATGAVYNNNIIQWDVYTWLGWTPTQMDGYYNTKEGGIAFAGYQYEGNVTSNQSSVMGAYGKIRYEYVYSQYTGAEMTLHTWTDDVWCSSSLTIVP